MKIKKRITIVANILVDEDFDTDYLCICEDISDPMNLNCPEIYAGKSNNFEVLDYISQEAIELEDDFEKGGDLPPFGNPLDTIKENAEEMESKENG